MEKAMKDAGYTNRLWAELPVQGYYETDELFEHMFDYSNMLSYVIDPEYTDFALAATEGTLNGCPII
jgi:hypothetical protein